MQGCIFNYDLVLTTPHENYRLNKDEDNNEDDGSMWDEWQ